MPDAALIASCARTRTRCVKKRGRLGWWGSFYKKKLRRLGRGEGPTMGSTRQTSQPTAADLGVARQFV
jgi:hypothetical protein